MSTISAVREKAIKPFHRIPELGLFLVLLAAIAIFSFFNSYFGTLDTAKVILVTVLYTGVVLIGEALLMIVGEIDLSVGAVASLGTITTGLFMTKWGGFSLPIAVLLGILVGALIGFVNGFITVKVGIPAFITTLSVMFLARGLAYVFSGGDPVYPLPADAGNLSRTEILGLPSSVWIFLVLFLIADLWLRHTVTGRKLYLIGGNQVAARLSGLKVAKIKIWLFVLSGVLSSFAGILLMSKMQRSDAVTGLGWELNVISAAAVGGIMMTGGGGTLSGAFIGLIFLQVILQGLVMLGLDPMLLNSVIGVIMITAVYIAFRKKSN